MSAPAASAASSSASSGAKTIYFMRHGETTFNVLGRMQGTSQESALTAKGHLGAKLAARLLQSRSVAFDAVYVSQLHRAKQTASNLCSILSLPPAIEDSLLNERAAGRTEGLTKAQIESSVRCEPDVKRLLGKSRMKVEVFEEDYEELTGVEAFAKVRQRARAFLRKLASESTQKCILVVTHGRFLSVLLTQLDSGYGGGRGEQSSMSNCTLTVVQFNPPSLTSKTLHADDAPPEGFSIAEQMDGDSLFNAGLHSYFHHKYKEDHWAMIAPPQNTFVATLLLQTDGKICIVEGNTANAAASGAASSSSAAAAAAASSTTATAAPSPPIELLVSLHPFDSRGYRSIVRLWSSTAPPASLLNRAPSLAEESALLRGAAAVAAAWRQLGLIAQVLLLGNNSHQCSADGKKVQLGTDHEPCFPHAHVICRGLPKHCYVPGVALAGPPAGEMFGARGGGANAPEGDREKPWTEPAQLERVRATLVDLLTAAVELQDAAPATTSAPTE